MPRSQGTTFGDLVGKLTVLVVECPKCSRTGRYGPAPADPSQRGCDTTIIDWRDALTPTARASAPPASATSVTHGAPI
jgi:hypothetical protein